MTKINYLALQWKMNFNSDWASDQGSDLHQQLELVSELDLHDPVEWGRKWHVNLNAEKTQLVLLTSLITLVLSMWKGMGLFFSKNYLLKCWGCLSLLKWIWALTLSLLPKLYQRKLESWFILWSFFLLKLPSISVNLVMSGMVLLVGSWKCYISYKNIYKTVGPSPAASLLTHCQNMVLLW